MKTWILILVWSHFSGGSNAVTVPGLSSEQACKVVAYETIKTVNPWNVKYRCVEVTK